MQLQREQSFGDCDQSALEVAIIQDSMPDAEGVPHNFNPSDTLAKVARAHEKPMMDLLRTSRLKIQAEEQTLASEAARASDENQSQTQRTFRG